MKKSFLVCLMVCFMFATPLSAWQGLDSQSVDSVEIGKGNPVRVGEYVDVFKLTQGERHGASVLNVADIGGPVQVEVHDLETGDSTILEMDSRPRKKLSELDDTLLNPKSK